jgi:predicted MPP superfamily phosphohydrolase
MFLLEGKKVTKTLTRWLVFGSSLITLAAGCYSFANRTPSSLASATDAAWFALFSPITLLPFWISLLCATNNKLANRILVIGAFLFSFFGAWLYYGMLVVEGKAEAAFAILIVPPLQFFPFLFLWLITHAINKKSAF